LRYYRHEVPVCGATNAECATLCFVDLFGTGYGNSWVQGVFTPTYTTPGILAYKATWESEFEYDYTYVIVQQDAGGGTWADYDTLASYTDIGSATEAFDLTTLGLTANFRIVFQFVADGGYSDGDGLNPTTCGAFALDDYSMGGPVETFEGTAVGSIPAGWGFYTSGCGDYASVQWLASLTPNLTADPCVALIPALCSMADSVLVFTNPGDPDYPHPMCQDNYAVSPIIDFTDHPGLPGRILDFEAFRSLPMNDHVFMYWQGRYKPGCASGGYSAWISDNYVYYSTEGTRCAHNIFDISTYIPPVANEAEIALAVLNLCDEDPWALGCTQTCNATPYYDNVSFGIYGSTSSPYISQRELDMFMDQFAEDGTLNPTSTADTRTANYLSNLVPPIFGDTMVCRGTAANMEVWLNFRMAQVGPNQTFTAPFFTWFPNVQLGGWFAARMDTTEVTSGSGTSTVLVTGNYMTTFHESDPTAPHPEGTEILPNNLFVPGTRIEYYLAACYVGSADTFYTPNNAQSSPEEFEILPMFISDGLGSIEWPCLIYADHFGQRGNEGERNSVRTGQHLAANGFEYDMFNRLGPSSDLRNGIGRFAANAGQVGGPGTAKYNWGPGATVQQFLAYSHCMLNTGNIYGYSIYPSDMNMLNSWLVNFTDADHQRFLWISGDQWVPELHRRTGWGARTFMNNVMCVTSPFGILTSYAASYVDFTYCLPMNGIAGGRIVSAAEPFQIRQNGCPRNFWEVAVSGAAGCNGVPEIEYDGRTPDAVAAISNDRSDVNYRTFAEGYDYSAMRDGSAGFFTCGIDAPLTAWFNSVLTWGGFTTTAVCNLGWVIEVKEPGVVPAVVTSLGQAFPNPMNPTATIKYTIGTPGKVMLRVFDVSGRVIRTLVDETKTAGQYSAIWDGKNDGGERVASGVFFYQLNAPGSELNKKIVILQ